MTTREFGVGVAIAAFALAALALAFAILAIIRRARAGQPRSWNGLVFRGVLIAGLLAVGAASLAGLPPPDLVNRPAPVAADATIAFVKDASGGNPRTVVGVSARDGATRWTQTFDEPIGALLSPAPNMILVTFNYSVFALRAADGSVLWRSQGAQDLSQIATDGARIYMQTPAVPARGTDATDIIALDLATGAQAWRAPLPVNATLPQIAVGDGLVFVASAEPDAGDTFTPWIVTALRAGDGAPQWMKRGAIVRAIVVRQGYVIVVPATGSVTALRERDGAIAWTGAPILETPDNPPKILAATADKDSIYMMAQPSRWTPGISGASNTPPLSVVAMTVDGAIRWRTAIPPSNTAWPTFTISDGVLLSGSSVVTATASEGYDPRGSLLSAYDTASGRTLWRDNTPPTGMSWDLSPQISPAGESGVAYLMGVQASPYLPPFGDCTSNCGYTWLYAVNVRTGAPWWRVRMGYITWLRL